jgi:endoglucanase
VFRVGCCLVALTVLFCAGRSSAAVANNLLDAPLSVKGNQIFDLMGRPVRLACTGYFAPGNIKTDLPGMVAAGFNCLRFTYYDATLSSDLATADKIVAEAQKVGIKVIIDHQGDEVPGPNNGWLPYPCNGLPFDTGPGTNGTDGCGDRGTISEAKYVRDWVTIAAHFVGNSTVIGFDLANEPHSDPAYWRVNPGGATWGDGSATDLQKIYEKTGNAIQAVNPSVLIIAEGIINFNGTFGNGEANPIAGSADLTLAASKPVVLNIPGKLVYSVHDYPTSISSVTPDSGSAKIKSMNIGWGYLVTQNVAPVWVGEMGASLDGVGPDSRDENLTKERSWANMMVAYLNGKDAEEGGPSVIPPSRAEGTSWFAWGNLDGESPDGTLADNGQLRPAQKAIYDQLQQ